MAGTVDIWNLALNLVGGSNVIDPDENSIEADLCRLHYPVALGMVLESGDWNFAIKRQELAESADVEPVFGFDSSFKLPADCARVIEAWDTKRGDNNSRYSNNNLQWQQEGEYISADASTQLYIRYVAKIEDPSKFTASFITALSTYLAYRLSNPITQSKTLTADLLGQFTLLMREAAINNGLSGRTKVLRSNVLMSARFR